MTVATSLPDPKRITVGPDGTVIGRRVDGRSFIYPLDLLWIEHAWAHPVHGTIGRMCLLQDALGRPGAVPARLDYLSAIRASTFNARHQMLTVAREAVPDGQMMNLLGLDAQALHQILVDAYGLEESHDADA